MKNCNKSLVIDGWSGIKHSFALVNQFQLQEMAKRAEVSVSHVDMPFHFQHWNRATNGAGFHDSDESILRISSIKGWH
jgi:hypothetical protein